VHFAVAVRDGRAYLLWSMAAPIARQQSGGDPVYFSRPGVALVTWNPDLRAVCLEPQAWADTTDAQAVLDAVIRALRAHHGSRWLLDGRKMKTIRRANQDWITQSWLPRAAAAGLKLAAIVQPASPAATVSEKGIDVRFFATVEMAAEWLTSPRAAA
jgi:hypothetical protein